MQYIQHPQSNIHSIFTAFDNFYWQYSDKTPNKTTNSRLIKPHHSKEFEELAQIFQDYGNIDEAICDYDLEYNKMKLPEYDKKNIIVCFSGGKDSIATALHYKKMGYNVYLYHLKGINKGDFTENNSAIKLAKYLELPLVIEEVKLVGNHKYMEHPMKNMIIANRALQYGIINNITTKIAFGNYYTSYLNDNPFEICAGDCRDMWNVYEHIIRAIIPKFRMYIPLKNINTTLNSITKDIKLLELADSCIGRWGCRQYLHDKNEDRYNVKLLNNRCGSCYKDVIEYMYCADHNVLKYNEEYYKHCLQICLNVSKTEGNNFYTVQSLWNDFMMYPMNKSKLYSKLKQSNIRKGKIIYE